MAASHQHNAAGGHVLCTSDGKLTPVLNPVAPLETTRILSAPVTGATLPL